MKVILVGATGTIGSAVNRLLKSKNCEVIGVSRTSNPALNINEPSSIDRFFQNAGKVDAIVCAAGDAAMAAVADVKDSDLEISLKSKLSGQINLVRKGMEHLNPGGVFVLTGGVLAYTPLPGTSMIAMVNAGLEGFVRAAALDMKDQKKIMIVHPAWVAETAKKFGMDPTPWPNADKTATAYWNAIHRGKNGSLIFVDGYEPK